MDYSLHCTQMRSNYDPGTNHQWARDSRYRTVSFTAFWYLCGFGEIPFSILSHGPLYGSSDGSQFVQKKIEVGFFIQSPR